MSSYDVFDENDEPIGRTASYDEVHSEGLWHRGVHVILFTPENEILMQKRSINLKFHPGEIEISVGGGVDAGETPEKAILREIKEEIGLSLYPSELKFIGKQKYNHRTKTQINRVHMYSYSARIDKKMVYAIKNSEEVESLFFIKKSKLKRALLAHRIK
jgi:8-oxo-dGTP pyrophosphatase MutT (NUDIX family)